MASAQAAGDTSHWDSYTYSLWDRTATFSVPLQAVFMVFGSEQWIGQLSVTVWGVAACILTTAIALRVLPVAYALAVGLFLALLPSQVLWSSLVLKDAAVWTVLAALGLIALLAARATGLRLALLGLGAGLALFLMAHLREHTLVVAGWALVGAAWFGLKDTRVPRLGAALLLAIVMPWLHGWGPGGEALARDPNLAGRRAANAIGAQSAFVDPTTGATGEEDVATETDGEDEQDGATGKGGNGDGRGNEDGEGGGPDGTAGPGEEPSTSAPDDVGGPAGDSVSANLSHLPRGLSVMLFEPFPWREATSANMTLARWETIVWYPLLALAAFGLLPALRRRDLLAFALLVGGGMLLVYALAEGNIGTAYRHRGEFVWLVALLAGFGLLHLVGRRSRRT
jgi:hypothetical protein